MFGSTRLKLSLGFLGVALLTGTVSLLVGWQLLYRAVLSEASNRIRLDLNAARETYANRIKTMAVTLNTSALGLELPSDIKTRDRPRLAQRLQRMARYGELDFAGLVAADGTVVTRLGADGGPAPDAAVPNPLVRLALDRRTAVAGTAVFDRESLLAENPEMADRARIQSLPTPRAAPQAEMESTSGLVLAAATPVFEDGQLLGVLYGGVLLNRSYAIVDTVRETVFQHETYRGRNIGTVTIFLGDLRVSTNVEDAQGRRAVGTRASREVRDRVLVAGQAWTDRAFVVNDWYLTAYEPIKDVLGSTVGMLYVGVLEAKYVDVRRRFLAVFTLITAAGVALAIGLGWRIANRIMRPVQQLISASAQVSQGNLSPEIGPLSPDEIGVLQKTFADMLASLREHERRQQAESETRLMQSEKQASIGRLAAGVAHEINNPLTGVLTFTHLLLQRRDLAADVRADLQTVARETDRVRKIVKGLLDFARQMRLDPEPTDVNKLVSSAVALVENQALLKGLKLRFEPGEGLPPLTLDRNQIQSALLNILINALDATGPGGLITVATGVALEALASPREGVEIQITDTGQGIPRENLDRLFDPFFTTKGVGQGTGLGLSVSWGIVERHGGTIRVRSQVGRGSTFAIWLPVEVAREQQQKVLVVDDDGVVLSSCERVLAAQGFAVRLVPGARAALSALAQELPELLIADVKMPDVDGLWLIRRARERHPALPIIVMSGYAVAEVIREGLALGADEFLPKPFTPDELLEAVRKALQKEQPP